MNRIRRKSFLISIEKNPGIYNILDGLFQGLFRLNEEETNKILNGLSVEEITYLQGNFQSFSEKKGLVSWINEKVRKEIG